MTWAVVLLAVCLVVRASGGYPLLERLMKLLMVFLAVSTIVAVAAAAAKGHIRVPSAPTPTMWNSAGIAFLVALMGWMPTPVDASAWPSLWMEERSRRMARQATLREALIDFKVGYGASLAMAVAFLSLGALVMFRTGATFAGRADEFAAQFVNMYTAALGHWSRPVIVTAAFITMLSTLLTVLDGYPRVVAAGCRVAWPRAEKCGRTLFGIVMITMMAGALLIYACLTSHMRVLVDATTTLAFLSAPLFAFLNIRAVAIGPVPHDAAPPRWLSILSWIGLAILIGFSVFFLVVHFGSRP
jgi:Mn2+/Fe2+ NRAMP family transporter